MANKSEVFFISHDFDKSIDRGSLKALTINAIKVVAQAKALAPRDKGQLANSIMYKLSDGSEDGFNDGSGEDPASENNKINETPKKGTALIGSGVNYAIHQEFGTKRMAPQPFMRPAIDIELRGGNGSKFFKETINAQIKIENRKKRASKKL